MDGGREGGRKGGKEGRRDEWMEGRKEGGRKKGREGGRYGWMEGGRKGWKKGGRDRDRKREEERAMGKRNVKMKYTATCAEIVKYVYTCVICTYKSSIKMLIKTSDKREQISTLPVGKSYFLLGQFLMNI